MYNYPPEMFECQEELTPWEKTIMRLSYLSCQLNGHVWNCESFISPNTGYEIHTCERCGESRDITWY